MQPRPVDLTQGSVSRALFHLALPLMGGMFLETSFNIVNAVWVGRTGTTSFAAVNLSSFPIWMLFALAGIVTTGTNAVVAQRLGAAAGRREEIEGARLAGALGIRSAILLGVGQSVAVLLGGRMLLRAMAGGSPEVEALVELGYAYLAFIFLFAPIHCANEAISSVLRAYGDTRTPMKVYAIGFSVNFVLDPFLILGWGPFPRLDILGAAIATNVSFLMVLVMYTFLLARGRLVYRLPERPPARIDRPLLRRILSIGLPPSLASVVFCLVYMLLTPIVGRFGPEALAALGIGHRVEGISYLVCYGFALASVTLVGQNIGAGREDRAEQAAWTAAGVVAAFTTVIGFTFWFAPGPLASLFTDDPEVHRIAVGYLRIIAFSQVLMGVAIVLDGAFAGAGRTIPPTMVSVPTALMRVPVAYAAVLHWNVGLAGVWWAISSLTMLRGLLTLLLFRLGFWRGGRREDLGLEPQLDEIPPGPHPLELTRGETAV